jgi:hypothetical protein
MYIEGQAYIDDLLGREKSEILALEIMILGAYSGVNDVSGITKRRYTWQLIVGVVVGVGEVCGKGICGDLHGAGELHSFSQQGSPMPDFQNKQDHLDLVTHQARPPSRSPLFDFSFGSPQFCKE